MPTSQRSATERRFGLPCLLQFVYTGRLPRASTEEARSGPQDMPCPNHPGSALLIAAEPAAVEQAEEAHMLAQ